MLSADSRLAGLSQYRRNISSAQARLALKGDALDQLGNLPVRAREIAISPLRPPSGGSDVELADGLTTRVNHNALEVFIDTGALDALQRLATGLDNDSDTGIADALTGLYLAFDQVQILVGENGARMKQLETALLRIADTETTLRTACSDLAEAEMEVAISDLVHRQNALEAAMPATTRLLTSNLTDYLR